MGVRAAQKGRMHRPRQNDILDVAPTPLNMAPCVCAGKPRADMTPASLHGITGAAGGGVSAQIYDPLGP